MKKQLEKMKWGVGCMATLLVCMIVVPLLLADDTAPDVLHRQPLLVNVAGDTAASSEAIMEILAEDVEFAREGMPAAAPTGTAAVPPGSLPTMMITDLDLAGEVDIVTLLRMMARVADVNLLVSPRVSGTITFTFSGVTWDNAFRSIMASAGLAYEWEDDVLRVMTVEDLRRELEMETARRDRQSIRQDLTQTEPLVLEVIPVRYVSAENIGQTVARTIAGDQLARGESAVRGRAAVSVDTESNQLIIHAIRADVDKAVQLVERLDRMRPLVQIEAQIVEATRDTARQLGMQWGGGASRVRGSRLVGVGDAGATAGEFVSDFPAQFAVGGASATGFGLGITSDRIGMNEMLQLQLTALQQQGTVNIQANPTVTTLDNEMAVIESGEERAYRVSTGTGNILDVSLEWKKAVLRLEVTPHVIDENMLRVVIVANKDSFDESKPQTNNEFPVNTKRARTTVMLANGETTMIGGFSLESSSEAKAGVPVLMHIPLVGRLFRSKTNLGRFDETIIFITPTIL